MPSPGPNQAGVAAALRSLQEQVNRLARRPAAAGGSSLLGYALVSCTFSSTLTSDGFAINPSSMGYTQDLGNHGIDIVGFSPRLRYCTDSLASRYLTLLTLSLTAGSNIVDSDVHQWTASEPLVLGVQSGGGIGSHDMFGSGAGTWEITAPTNSRPSLAAYCTGGTDRTYNISQMRLSIFRFANPT